eukprot:c26129_g1_i4 orf=76-462(+)
MQNAIPSTSSVPSTSMSSSVIAQAAEDTLFAHLADELTFAQDRKMETERALTEDLMASLRKEGELLDADAWKYSAPRSQLHLTSMAGVNIAIDSSGVPGSRENRANHHQFVEGQTYMLVKSLPGNLQL